MALNLSRNVRLNLKKQPKNGIFSAGCPIDKRVSYTWFMV